MAEPETGAPALKVPAPSDADLEPRNPDLDAGIAALRTFADADAALAVGATVLVACSGGPDSMALVEACRQLGRWRLVVATVDHGLHPDSARWAEAVAACWSARGLAVRVCPVALAPGGDLEARARAARYAALEATLAAEGVNVGLTAHTAEDQAETLLMRLGAGAGLRGMAGVPAARGPWRRPWLGLGRAVVRAAAAAAGLPVVLDPANLDGRFVRARLRSDALPALAAALGPGWAEGAARAAALLREAEAREAFLGAAWWDGLVRPRAAGLALDLAGLRAAPPALRRWALVRALGAAMDRRVQRHVEALEQVALGTRTRHLLPHGRQAWRAGGALVVGVPAPVPSPVPVSGVGGWPFGAGRLEVAASGEGSAEGEAAASWARVWSPAAGWTLRGPWVGDVWRGRAGRKPLGRALRDAGVGEPERAAWPVLVAAQGVVWSAGLEAAESGSSESGSSESGSSESEGMARALASAGQWLWVRWLPAGSPAVG